MSPNSFIHLRAHTEYCITQSTLKIDDLIKRAKNDGQTAVAMTDINNMFGAIRFYTQARSAGLKPILGVDVQIQSTPSDFPVRDEAGNLTVPEITTEPPHRMLFICTNFNGYQSLMRLISRGYTDNMINGAPTIKEEWLKEEGTTGLLALSGDANGLIGRKLQSGENDKAHEIVQRYKTYFNNDFYLEVQRKGIDFEDQWVHEVVKLADQTQTFLVATHPMEFSEREDFIAHELKVCDKNKKILHDRVRERPFTPEQHFQTQAKMVELFADIPDAISNTELIARKCNLEIPLGKNVLPVFPTPEGMSVADFFKKESQEGLEKRLVNLYPDPQERAQKLPQYQERLDREVKTILKMGFEGYFMIVTDFIQWAKDHKIPVGPGRGSGAGSLVAYSLGITDMDPLKYNLLFERFLNPERVSMPDFDVDFCQARRELVIDYVTNKYGQQAVAGIANINTHGAKGAIKAAGRAMGIPLPAVERIAKLIVEKPGTSHTIEEYLTHKDLINHELVEAYNSSEQTKKLIDYSSRIQGLPNAIGQHASGIVMAPGKISDFAPLYIPEGKTQTVTQYDKDDIEKAGLVKFDFLGLKTLTEIDKACIIIKEDFGIDFDINKISLTDTETLKAYRAGDTISVFQFESPGMQRLLKEFQPDKFEDLVALNSLYRPGPMDLIPTFVARKHGLETITYADERMKPILQETYGIMIYQEQVMQIAQTLGGYTLGGADLLRRAMGKKKVEEMAHHRQIFADGASKNGMDPQAAGTLFDQMEKFAGYGFNKSHAAVYSLLSFQTSYLKQHYPAAFYSAFLTVEGNEDANEIPVLLADAKKHGIEILPPSINHSKAEFYPDKTNKKALRYGLSTLKGITDIASNIELERTRAGEFKSLEDFCLRMEKGSINKKSIELLIKSGAFDELHPNRAESLNHVPKIMEYLKAVDAAEKKINKEKASAASDVMAALSKGKGKKKALVDPSEIPLPAWETLPEQDLLAKSAGEKDAFGFYYSANPYGHFKKLYGGLEGTVDLEKLGDLSPGYAQHWVCGMVSEVKQFQTKRGKMGIISITDGNKNIELKAFSDAFEPNASKIKADQFLLFAVQVKEDNRDGSIGFLVQDVKSGPEIKELLANSLHVALREEQIPKLAEILQKHPGDYPVNIFVPKDTSFVKSSAATLTTNLSDQCIDELSAVLGSRWVKIGYMKTLPVQSNARKYPARR